MQVQTTQTQINVESSTRSPATRLEGSTFRLVELDRFKQGLEITDAKAL